MEKEVKIHVDYVDCVIKYIAVKELAHNEIWNCHGSIQNYVDLIWFPSA